MGGSVGELGTGSVGRQSLTRCCSFTKIPPPMMAIEMDGVAMFTILSGDTRWRESRGPGLVKESSFGVVNPSVRLMVGLNCVCETCQRDQRLGCEWPCGHVPRVQGNLYFQSRSAPLLAPCALKNWGLTILCTNNTRVATVICLYFFKLILAPAVANHLCTQYYPCGAASIRSYHCVK